MHTGEVSDSEPDEYPPHLQWATDPVGRRYWVTGGPAFGFNPLVAAIKGLFRSRRPAKIEVEGVVTVTRVEGEQETEVFVMMCDTLDEARAKAKTLAKEIEAGTFQEQPPQDG
jgi:hypothetical protein